MNIFDQLLADNQIPKFVRVRHEMDRGHIDDIEGAVAQAMQREGTLDRIKPGDSVCITAGSRDVANIARVIREYGEENWAAQIARVLCDRRKLAPIETTAQLVDVIDAAIPKKVRARDGSHPARRTFQALRIAVNDELKPLEQALDDFASLLKPGGRLCVIAFHSLEDRVVKTTFHRLAHPCTCPPSFPVCVCGKKPTVTLITRKPITASDGELEENPRARSATLRIAEGV